MRPGTHMQVFTRGFFHCISRRPCWWKEQWRKSLLGIWLYCYAKRDILLLFWHQLGRLITWTQSKNRKSYFKKIAKISDNIWLSFGRVPKRTLVCWIGIRLRVSLRADFLFIKVKRAYFCSRNFKNVSRKKIFRCCKKFSDECQKKKLEPTLRSALTLVCGFPTHKTRKRKPRKRSLSRNTTVLLAKRRSSSMICQAKPIITK